MLSPADFRGEATEAFAGRRENLVGSARRRGARESLTPVLPSRSPRRKRPRAHKDRQRRAGPRRSRQSPDSTIGPRAMTAHGFSRCRARVVAAARSCGTGAPLGRDRVSAGSRLDERRPVRVLAAHRPDRRRGARAGKRVLPRSTGRRPVPGAVEDAQGRGGERAAAASPGASADRLAVSTPVGLAPSFAEPGQQRYPAQPGGDAGAAVCGDEPAAAGQRLIPAHEPPTAPTRSHPEGRNPGNGGKARPSRADWTCGPAV
ncbi:hypothetical protein A4R44_00771 [Amycolatopsis sp. M39]|nr:hypothetical protein A4R44_00771 [Amycolatopsis sp. M39]